MSRKRSEIVASRQFKYNGRPATVDILCPKSAGAIFTCELFVCGLPAPRYSVTRGKTPIEALISQLFHLGEHLESLGEQLEWPVCPYGQTGLPIHIIVGNTFGPTYHKQIREVVAKVIEDEITGKVRKTKRTKL